MRLNLCAERRSFYHYIRHIDLSGFEIVLLIMKPAVLISILGVLLSVTTATAVPAAHYPVINHHLETRAKKPAKSPVKRPPSVVNPPPAAKPPVKPTPKPGKPTRTPKKPTKSSSTKVTPTSTPGKLPIGKTCKQIAQLRQQEEPDYGAGLARLRLPRSELYKRVVKGSVGPQGPCKVPKFTSNQFEPFGKEKEQNVSHYHALIVYYRLKQPRSPMRPSTDGRS